VLLNIDAKAQCTEFTTICHGNRKRNSTIFLLLSMLQRYVKVFFYVSNHITLEYMKINSTD